MRCVNKAESGAAARKLEAGEQAVQISAAGDNMPAAAYKQPATPIVAGARGHPRTASSPAALDVGGSPMEHGPRIDVLDSGESDSPSDSNPSSKSDRTVAETTKSAPRGSLDKNLRHEMFGLSDDSENSSPGLNRSR